MRSIILLLVLVSTIYSAACTFVNITNLTSYSLDQGTCIEFNNSNNITVIISAKNYTTNNNITIPAGQSYTDPASQNIYSAQSQQFNINKTAQFGECLDLPNASIHFCAPTKPMINKISNLAPGQADLLPDFGYSCYAPPKLNVVKTLGWGETFTNDAYGIQLTCPKYNKEILLTGNDTSYFDEKTNISARLNLSEQYYELICNGLFNSTPKIWYDQNISNSCNSAIIPFCADDLLNHCTVNELFQKNGAYVCMNRIATDTKTQCNLTQTQLTTTQSSLASCQATQQNIKDEQKAISDSNINYTLLVFGLVALSVVAWMVYKKHRSDKTNKQGET